MFNSTLVPKQRVIRRFFCTFLPFLVRKQKGTSTKEHWEAYPTDHFNEIGHASMALLNELMELVPDKQTSILDMGCNVGRHLNYLYQQGYRNLRGVDFSGRAIEDMAIRYPDMHEASKLTVASFQDYLSGSPKQVDLVYTRGATFELVPPSFPLIKQVCKIARQYVVMCISETGHAYPRFWEYEFARNGFELVHLRRPASSLAPDHKVSLLTFKRIDS